MRKYILIYSFLSLFLPLNVSGALAQGMSPKCRLVPEKIVTLGVPVFGGSLKWKRVLLQTEENLGQTHLLKLVKKEDGFLVLGEHISNQSGQRSLQIIPMDFNGKFSDASLKNIKISGRVVDVLAHKDQFIVLLEKEAEKHAEIRIYTHKGQLVRSKTFKTKLHIIHPGAIAVGQEGAVYLATQYEHKKQISERHSVVYKLNTKLGETWKRSFLPSTPTKIHALHLRKGGGFLVAGEIAVSGGQNRQRMGGWLMALSDFGGMEWQRAYPRGHNASLSFVHETPQGHIFTAGMASPLKDNGDNQDSAAWIMTNYANSNPIWQRYFKGSYAYKTVDVEMSDNNQATLVMQGIPTQKGGVSHVRVIDLSQLGEIVTDRAYLEGSGVEGRGIISFEDKGLGRYLIGATEMPSTQEEGRVLDGWIASINHARKISQCQ